jgi:hypothetical protein
MFLHISPSSQLPTCGTHMSLTLPLPPLLFSHQCLPSPPTSSLSPAPGAAPLPCTRWRISSLISPSARDAWWRTTSPAPGGCLPPRWCPKADPHGGDSEQRLAGGYLDAAAGGYLHAVVTRSSVHGGRARADGTAMAMPGER